MRKCDGCGAVNGDNAEFCGLCFSALITETGSGEQAEEAIEKTNRTPLVLVALAVIVVAVLSWSTTRPSVISEATGPKMVVFNWDHENLPYSLELALDQDIYRFYGNQPKGILFGPAENGLSKYLNAPEGGDTIKELVASISTVAAQRRLSDEETLELAVAFVQSIPYDFETADTSRAGTPRYPYEVLYDNRGICSEKSFLAYVLLREMGYGAAIFDYPSEEHMNIGIQSPLEYSTDQTGYSVVETTNDIKIGIIPDMGANGQALQTEALQEFNLRNPSTSKGKNLSSPIVFARTQGKTYSGVIETFQTSAELADILEILGTQEALIKSEQADLNSLRRRLDHYLAANDMRSYNPLVDSYNERGKNFERLIIKYDNQVARYNTLLRHLRHSYLAPTVRAAIG